MLWRPPTSTRTDPHLPCTTVFRSERSEEVVVGQEEALDGAVQDHHLDLRVFLQGLNDGFQLGDRPGAEYVQGWVVAGDAPVKLGRAHVGTPVTNAHIVCRILLEQNTP